MANYDENVDILSFSIVTPYSNSLQGDLLLAMNHIPRIKLVS